MNKQCNLQPPYLAISLIAAATLAYEIHLLNLFSVVYWYHFGYMIISIAMLGVGISGTLLYITSTKILRMPNLFFLCNSLVFCISSVFLYGYVQINTFNALEILWQWQSWRDLLFIYILLMCPFIAGANCIAASFIVYGDKLGGIYSADLIGAGIGAVSVCLLMDFLDSRTIMQGIFLLAFVAVLLVVRSAIKEISEKGKNGKPVIGGLCLVLIGAIVWAVGLPSTWYGPHPNIYKDVSRALAVLGAEEVYRIENRFGVTQVLWNSSVPFRSAPGLSSSYTGKLPGQYATFNNGDWRGAVSLYSRENIEYLKFLPSFLAPTILASKLVGNQSNRRIVVNNWSSVLQINGALSGGNGAANKAVSMETKTGLKTEVNTGVQTRADKEAQHALFWVNVNPNMYSLVSDVLSHESGWNQQQLQSEYVQKSVRQFVFEKLVAANGHANEKGFDLIQLELAPALFGVGSGVSALAQDYMLTQESIERLIQSLKEKGLLSFNFTDSIPPKLTYKLIATLKAGFNAGRSSAAAAVDISQHLLVIRNWQQVSVVLSATPIIAKSLAKARVFAKRMRFSFIYYPGIRELDKQVFSVSEKQFAHGIAQLLKANQSFGAEYAYGILPSFDSEPNFYHFFRWQSFWELYSQRERGGTPLIEWSYLVLVLTLVQAVVISLLLVLSPAYIYKKWLRRKSSLQDDSRERYWFLIYFAAIGFGFMFFEINLIQRVLLNFQHPTLAVAVIIGGLLVFSGIGAWGAQSLLPNYKGARESNAGLSSKLVIVLAAITCLSLVYVWVLPWALKGVLILALWEQIVFVLLLIAPLGCLLGMPLPLGLALLNQGEEGCEHSRLPLAWAVNACCSVISAVLATLLALHWSLNVVWCLAAFCYLGAIFICWMQKPADFSNR